MASMEIEKRLEGPVELDYRNADGIEVSLLWFSDTNDLKVSVHDSKNGIGFDIMAPPDKALDVFHHPFAYEAAGPVAMKGAMQEAA
jgi:hypothetical protein